MNAKGLFVVCIILMTGMFLRAADDHQGDSGKKAKSISLETFDKLRQSEDHVVVDVRTEKEFKAGHIPGAINLDVNATDFDAKLAKLNKSKTYMVHCMVGHRSAKAGGKFLAAGFTNVLDFTPGLKAWEQAGKPVEK